MTLSLLQVKYVSYVLPLLYTLTGLVKASGMDYLLWILFILRVQGKYFLLYLYSLLNTLPSSPDFPLNLPLRFNLFLGCQ